MAMVIAHPRARRGHQNEAPTSERLTCRTPFTTGWRERGPGLLFQCGIRIGHAVIRQAVAVPGHIGELHQLFGCSCHVGPDEC